MSKQFGRRVSLVVIPPGSSTGLDLSQMQFKFDVKQSDLQSPNNARIRVYNLSDATVRALRTEYTKATTAGLAQIILQAGYEGADGNYGVIFQGSVKQLRIGKEGPTDKYLDILAADGDLAHNFAFIRKSLAAGSTYQDQFNALVEAMKAQGIMSGNNQGIVTPVKITRGKVLYGMARDGLRDLTDSFGASWSIQNGVVQVLPLTGYLPGQAVVLNSATGLIGRPEQTEDGITARCLLNPLLKIGGLVQIDNDSINRTVNLQNNFVPFDRYTGVQVLAPVTDDGFYRLYVVEHHGDTRGNDWYSELVCLAVDITSKKVKAQ
jgi:hypothetical protein